MWRWIRPWHDWLMDDIVTPRRLASQSRAIYYRSEKSGLTLENQPVPWSAETVVVEALLRLPANARHRSDYTIRWPGLKPVVAEQIRLDEGATRHRVFFRLPVPPTDVRAELCWRQRVLGELEIHVVSRDRFFRDLRLELPTAFVALGGRSIAARTFVSTQQQGLSACGVLRSSTGLSPVADAGLTATFHNARSGASVTQEIPLTAGQLTGREAIINALPPRMPRQSGEWTVVWRCGAFELAGHRLNSITPKAMAESLRVCDTRFMVVTADGRFQVVRQLPADGVVRAGPCFLIASRLPGLAGLAKLSVTLRVQGGGEQIPVFEQNFLVTDGPTPFAPGLLEAAELHKAIQFDLRHRNTVIGSISLSPFPAAHLNGEGGFTSAPEFSWCQAADDELAERLEKLMSGR